ncbi:hypothetical protein DFH06DRAFT_1336124 [Mycena polygramma]|nr:hypothetical protein DFH06DRAFT_1336124 [Mycena polygramma]
MSKRKRTDKPRKRVLRENRRNLRLWAEGPREEVLLPHLEAYADALERSWRDEREYLQRICNEYHARISWRLSDQEQPDLPLPSYDPHAPPKVEELNAEETQAKRARIKLLNERIRRWYKYRVRRLRKQLCPKIDGRQDAWSVLLAKLASVTAPPKARQAFQQYMHEAYATDIAPVVAQRWAGQQEEGSNVQTQKSPTGAFCAAIARECFAALPQSVREDYAKRAKQVAIDARAKYDEEFNKVPSRTPEARQACIDNVGAFIAPILQGITERTGLHSVIILGGPIPKYGGDLRTLFVSYSRNRSGSGPGAHFPQWRPDRFNDTLTLMKEYLATAFSPQDIAETALPDSLAGATYTIPPDGPPNDEDSSDLADSDDDSNDDSEDTEDEELPPKKRKKAAPAKLTPEQERAANIARNKALLAPLTQEIREGFSSIMRPGSQGDGAGAKGGANTKPPAKKRKAPEPVAPRKSTHLNGPSTDAPTNVPPPSPPPNQTQQTQETPSPPPATQTQMQTPLPPPPPPNQTQQTQETPPLPPATMQTQTPPPPTVQAGTL